MQVRGELSATAIPGRVLMSEIYYLARGGDDSRLQAEANEMARAYFDRIRERAAVHQATAEAERAAGVRRPSTLADLLADSDQLPRGYIPAEGEPIRRTR